jgi:energy-converting hydrogenase B subunit Q
MADSEMYAVSILCDDCQGALRDISDIMTRHGARIMTVSASVVAHGDKKGLSEIYLEFRSEDGSSGSPDDRFAALFSELNGLSSVISVDTYQPLLRIFGKRVIIIGGGAQVAQVAMGAVNEADRHNIRGEKISVDTIPIVGEKDLAATIDAVCRLPRVSILVLAGSLMGGEITNSVDRVRSMGIPVISLNMAGSVAEHADLVVTDPIQAGVFAVMHISEKGVFDIKRVRGRVF